LVQKTIHRAPAAEHPGVSPASVAPEEGRQNSPAKWSLLAMAHRIRDCDGGRSVRRLLSRTLTGSLLAALALSSAAPAADQVVSGTVVATLGVSVDDTGVTSGTSPSVVTHEQRGNTLLITVIPAG
jgi:hypothetical protein